MLEDLHQFKWSMNVYCMQVSHHPPILAFQSESHGRSYEVYGEIEIKNKFWGRSIEVCLSNLLGLSMFTDLY